MTDLTAYIIEGCVCLLLLGVGIFLIRGNGKGAWLIAGYNTMRIEKQEKYDKKALCRFVGWLLIAIAACMAMVVASVYLKLAWLGVCGGVAIVALAIAAVIYANTGGRFKKKE